MEQTNLYIDGRWRQASNGERFDVINPATEQVLASVASADTADADAAPRCCRRRLRSLGCEDAARTLGNPAQGVELMTARLDEFARLITLENGKASTDARVKLSMPQSSFAGSRRKPSVPTA